MKNPSSSSKYEPQQSLPNYIAETPKTVASTAKSTELDFFVKRAPFYTNPDPAERHTVTESIHVICIVVGFTVIIVIFAGFLLGSISSLPMAASINGLLPEFLEGNIMLVNILVVFGLTTGNLYFQNSGKFKGTNGGLRVWKYEDGSRFFVEFTLPSVFFATLVVFGPFMALAYYPNLKIVSFYNLELPALVCWFILFLVRTQATQSKFYIANGFMRKEGAELITTMRRSSIHRVSEALINVPDQSKSEAAKGGNSLKWYLSLLSNMLIGLMYPFTVITLFRSFGVGGRMAIVLFFHPLLYEFLMHGYRANTGLTQNGIGETVAVAPMRNLSGVFLIESYLVMIRRIMLCNLGSFQATTIAIIITGIEETAMRSTIEVSEQQSLNRATTINTRHSHSNETFGTATSTSISLLSPQKKWPS